MDMTRLAEVSCAMSMLRTVTNIALHSRKTTGEADISNLDGTDICTLRLQQMSAQDRNVTRRAK